jgi:hypothetical protein
MSACPHANPANGMMIPGRSAHPLNHGRIAPFSLAFAVLALFGGPDLSAQYPDFPPDDVSSTMRVGNYTPVNLLQMKGTGRIISTPEEWWQLRRPEIFRDVQHEVWGTLPADSILPSVSWTTENPGWDRDFFDKLGHEVEHRMHGTLGPDQQTGPNRNRFHPRNSDRIQQSKRRDDPPGLSSRHPDSNPSSSPSSRLLDNIICLTGDPSMKRNVPP